MVQTPPSSKADAGVPSWVPKDASLTIVSGANRDKNLGLAPPPAVSPIVVDAGGVELDIRVRPKP